MSKLFSNVRISIFSTLTAFYFLTQASLGIAQTGLTDPALKIPDSLLAGANSIILQEHIEIEVTSEALMREKSFQEILVLNEEGKFAGFFFGYSDEYTEYEDIDISLYTSGNQLIRRYLESEIKNTSFSGSEEFVADARRLYLGPTAGTVPYKVVVSFVRRHVGFIKLPSWFPQYENQSVLLGEYVLKAPQQYQFHYKVMNGSMRFSNLTDNQRIISAWSVQNLVAKTIEDLGPSWNNQFISLTLMPEWFTIGGYRGCSSSWKSFGDWYNRLILAKQNLPDQAVIKFQTMVQGINDPIEKQKVLYEYLQKNTRYISVQLGIGSWQPLNASFVFEHGYGDCKALVNYMQSILQAVGITSYPVLIAADEDDINAGFVSNEFNHVILMVPSFADTVWLECTSNHLPFNFLSDFTEGRHALVICPDGGYIVKTPGTAPYQNLIDYSFEVDLTDPPNAIVKAELTYTGNEAINYYLPTKEYCEEEKIKRLRQISGLPNFKLISYSYSDSETGNPTGLVSMEVQIPEYGQMTGSRFFFSPFPSPVSFLKIKQNGDRVFPVCFSYSFLNSYQINFSVPDSFNLETLPANAHIENEFMSYQTLITHDSSGYKVSYDFKLKTTQIPPESFSLFKESISKVNADQKKKIVLVRNQ